MSGSDLSLLQRLRFTISKGVFLRRALTLGGGTVMGQLFGLLASPILARIYSVQDFGNLQAYTTLLGFGFVVVALRYELAVLLPSDEVEAANVVVLGLASVVLTTLTFAGILLVLVLLDGLPKALIQLIPYLWLIPISMLGAGVYVVLSYYALRKHAFSEVSKSKLIQGMGQVITQLLLGLVFKAGLLGLLLGDAIGRISGSSKLTPLMRSAGVFRTVTWTGIKKMARRYKSFPLISSWSALLNSLGTGLPVLLLGGGFGATVLGWYALVDRLMGLPTAVIGQSVSQVYMVEAAPLVVSDLPALRQLFIRRLSQLALAGFAPFLIVFVAAPWLVSVIFGEAWREAGFFARILVPMNYVGFIVWPLMPTLNILERQKWQLGWDLGRLAVTIGSIAAVRVMGGGPREAIGAFGGALLLGYLSHAWLSYRAIMCRIADQSAQN